MGDPFMAAARQYHIVQAFYLGTYNGNEGVLTYGKIATIQMKREMFWIAKLQSWGKYYLDTY